MGAETTYLIDNQGRLVHSWQGQTANTTAAYLLENGLLLRCAKPRGQSYFQAGGTGGLIQLLDWDGTPIWELEVAAEDLQAHHDVKMLPNGNLLLIAWERIEGATALAAGRDPALLREGELWPDMLLEVNPEREVVWQWRVWDHLVQDYDPAKPNYGHPAEHPELIDLNYTSPRAEADWTHINSVDYNDELDQIILSVHGFDEVWVIDRSTTVAEAAGHSGGIWGGGGDLLYRWGNPAACGLGTARDKTLFGQHDAQWIASGLSGAGDILVFNNGLHRGGRQGESFSSVDQFAPTTDGEGNYLHSADGTFGPQTLTWTYSAENPKDFYSANISGAQRLANGDTLICEGTSGAFFEVTALGELVWKYVNPVTARGVLGVNDRIPSTGMGQTNSVFKIRRYAPDYSGLAGRDLTPGNAIEE